MPKRPRYETAADRTREAGAMQRFVSAFQNVTAEKLSQGHRADFLAVDGNNRKAYVEVKTRTCTSGQYETYHVSHDKLKSLLALAEKDGYDAVLLVQWKDKTGYIPVKRYLANATFKQGGRWDRKDKFDVEEMAEVPISLFKFI